MKISYLITVHNEGAVYLRPLFDKILQLKDPEDEIIVLDDGSNDPDTIEVIKSYWTRIDVHHKTFEGNFADHKNYLNSLATGDFIFQLDADELPNDSVIKAIKEIIIMNEEVDLFYLPRINLVSGLTQDDINQWGWSVNNRGFVNFPDVQGRIYKNSPDIKWEGKIHERIVGTSKHTILPYQNELGELVDDYCILHVKDIQRQRYQNELYNNLENIK